MPSCCPPGGYCAAHQAMLDRVDRLAAQTPDINIYPRLTAPSLPARGRIAEPKYDSKLEQRYAGHLALRQRAGEVHAYWYEPFGLKLAKKCYYHPDFLIQLPDGTLQIHEIKGAYIREDSWIKLKTAAKQYPCFVFLMIQEGKNNGWDSITIEI